MCQPLPGCFADLLGNALIVPAAWAAEVPLGMIAEKFIIVQTDSPYMNSLPFGRSVVCQLLDNCLAGSLLLEGFFSSFILQNLSQIIEADFALCQYGFGKPLGPIAAKIGK